MMTATTTIPAGRQPTPELPAQRIPLDDATPLEPRVWNRAMTPEERERYEQLLTATGRDAADFTQRERNRLAWLSSWDDQHVLVSILGKVRGA